VDGAASGTGGLVSAQPEPPRIEDRSGLCPVCSTPVAASETRCPACNYDLAGVAGRPGAYSRMALWWTVAGFVVVYLIVVGIVIATN
jgi:predicted amidophosphoribosyltransferase